MYSGKVKVGNYGADGKYQLTRILARGETFGEFTLFAELPRTHSAEALNDTQVVQLNELEYAELLTKAPETNAYMLSSLAFKLHSALELLDDIRRLPLPVRIAKLLSNQAKENSTSTLNIRQSDIADIMGVTVLSSHKALQSLVALSLIKLSYGKVTIVDIERLTDWVESYSSLHAISEVSDTQPHQ